MTDGILPDNAITLRIGEGNFDLCPLLHADANNLRSLLEMPDVKSCLLVVGGILENGPQKALPAESNARFAGEIIDAIRFAPVPVAGILHTCAYGASLNLFLACHLRFASPEAVMKFSLGSSQVYNGFERDFRHSPELMQTFSFNETVDAVKAMRLGLVHEIVEGAIIENKVRDYVNGLISGKHKKVVSSVLHAVHASRNLPVHEALAVETRLFCDLAKEGGHE